MLFILIVVGLAIVLAPFVGTETRPEWLDPDVRHPGIDA